METSKEGVVINDFDGVYNRKSTPAYLHVINRVLEECGVEMDPDIAQSRVMQLWGMPPRRIVASMIKHYPQKKDKLRTTKRALDLYKAYMSSDFVDMIEPVDGSAETLQELSSRHRLALNTAADRDILFKAVMPRLGIDPEVFDQELTWTADEIPSDRSKPDPYVINQILKSTGASEVNTVMIGDSQADVLSAYFAGVTPIVPLTGNLSEKDAELMEVKYIIEDVTKIFEVLPRALGHTSFKKHLSVVR